MIGYARREREARNGFDCAISESDRCPLLRGSGERRDDPP
jgi:hypothetical protein